MANSRYYRPRDYSGWLCYLQKRQKFSWWGCSNNCFKWPTLKTTELTQPNRTNSSRNKHYPKDRNCLYLHTTLTIKGANRLRTQFSIEFTNRFRYYHHWRLQLPQCYLAFSIRPMSILSIPMQFHIRQKSHPTNSLSHTQTREHSGSRSNKFTWQGRNNYHQPIPLQELLGPFLSLILTHNSVEFN